MLGRPILANVSRIVRKFAPRFPEDRTQETTFFVNLYV